MLQNNYAMLCSSSIHASEVYSSCVNLLNLAHLLLFTLVTKKPHLLGLAKKLQNVNFGFVWMTSNNVSWAQKGNMFWID
jgi:hypothetical protein